VKKFYTNITKLNTSIILLIALIFSSFSCSKQANQALTLKSPDEKIAMDFKLCKIHSPLYSVKFNNQEIISTSSLGLDIKNQNDLLQDFKIINASRNHFKEIWKPVWGEESEINNEYNELLVELQENKDLKRKLNIRFKAFNDGLAFRYEIPKQKNIQEFIIKAEETYFNFTENHKAWWIPSDYDTYEFIYNESLISDIPEAAKNEQHGHSRQKTWKGVNTPITMESPRKDYYIAIHEAALVNYAGMTLIPDKESKYSDYAFKADLVPWANGDKVRAAAPLKSPWRVILISETPEELLKSRMILNLNEANKIKDTSFIKPLKYLGIWWSMHLGIATWGQNGRHDANTENTIRHLEFAKKHNMDAVLVEGWNKGWEQWYQEDNFDFTTAYDDFNLAEVTKFANKAQLQLIGHCETGGQFESFEERLEEVFSLYEKHGVHTVKTGYAGTPFGKDKKPHYHHSQRMVKHYNDVIAAAVKHKINLNVHEPIKPTGLQRTYPNLMSQEGLRGMEWNAWSDGNLPYHTCTLPFTRGLAGPMDYTPGIFDLDFSSNPLAKRKLWNKIGGLDNSGGMHSTLARQLALYIVLYSPLQMASDLIENYENNPAFEFIEKVPVDWSRTEILDAEIGDYVAIARRDKNSENWFLGAITNEESRVLNISLDFLDADRTYSAKIFKDAKDSHYQRNPEACEIIEKSLNRTDKLKLDLAPGGGVAIILKRI
jgi:alpha-glucosidase